MILYLLAMTFFFIQLEIFGTSWLWLSFRLHIFTWKKIFIQNHVNFANLWRVKLDIFITYNTCTTTNHWFCFSYVYLQRKRKQTTLETTPIDSRAPVVILTTVKIDSWSVSDINEGVLVKSFVLPSTCGVDSTLCLTPRRIQYFCYVIVVRFMISLWF